MIDSLRKTISIPEIPVLALLSTGIIFGFFFLLLQNQIHPVVIYFLQLYLSV